MKTQTIKINGKEAVYNNFHESFICIKCDTIFTNEGLCFCDCKIDEVTQ